MSAVVTSSSVLSVSKPVSNLLMECWNAHAHNGTIGLNSLLVHLLSGYTGNFSWGSESVTRKTRIIDVVYNASNNELVRTKTLVKGAIVQVDATPFRQWYEAHYGLPVGKKSKKAVSGPDKQNCARLFYQFGDLPIAIRSVQIQEGAAEETVKKSGAVTRKIEARKADAKMDPHVEDQFSTGRLYAILSSRPGQAGRADGYILEGRELDFYREHLFRLLDVDWIEFDWIGLVVGWETIIEDGMDFGSIGRGGVCVCGISGFGLTFFRLFLFVSPVRKIRTKKQG